MKICKDNWPSYRFRGVELLDRHGLVSARLGLSFYPHRTNLVFWADSGRTLRIVRLPSLRGKGAY
jgi:hypothetical protein